MKRITLGIMVIFVMILATGCIYSANILTEVKEAGNMNMETDNFEVVIESKRETSVSKTNTNVKNYFVYTDDKILKVFQVFDEAVKFASDIPGKNYIQDENKNILWDNYIRYRVKGSDSNSDNGKLFDDLPAAIKYAKASGINKVVLKDDTEKTVWSSTYSKEHIIKNAVHTEQLPELARGCEVTSLAMLLKSIGVSADKMILAEQIKKDPTPYKNSKGVVTFGNPHDGFVGDIYSFKKQGLGVYNEPIYELAQKYTNRAINLTGCELSDILYYVSQDIPVWIITNSYYSHLPESEFRTWQTPTGEIKITYREHSVIIAGYDDNYIYFNDPLSSYPKSRTERQSFTDAYNQMGKQSISCLP